MGLGSTFKSKITSDVIAGAATGFVIGLAFTFISWIMTGVFKLLLCWDTGVWPNGFPGHIPDFILSGFWAIIIILTFTVAGAIAGFIKRRHLKIW